MQGNTEAYKDVAQAGRLMIFELDLLATTLIIAVIYGCTGAEPGNAACERTEDLSQTMKQELSTYLADRSW